MEREPDSLQTPFESVRKCRSLKGMFVRCQMLFVVHDQRDESLLLLWVLGKKALFELNFKVFCSLCGVGTIF